MSPDPSHEPTDSEQVKFGFGEGGVPFPLMLVYLAFIVFFVWYVLEYQLPDFLSNGAAPVTVMDSVPE